MKKSEMRELILDAKENCGMSWSEIADFTELSPEYVCSACLGMNHMDEQNADSLVAGLKLDIGVSKALQAFPHKKWDQVVPTDPVIYRWYEMVGVYGETIKEMIHEKFGDGIMSAIDFSMKIDKEEHPAGDRVLVTLSGKFLPYRSW